MLFHEAIARSLADHGIKTIFGVLGDANLYMMDSFERQVGGSYYSLSNEGAAVLAANGFACTSGGLGVATVTHGPALTNTVTALVESVKDHTPLLVIAGDTSVVDKDNFQNVPQRDVVLSSGAGFEQIRSANTVIEDVATAIRRALLERRPIVLNVPVDFQWQEVVYSSTPARLVKPQAVSPDPAALDAAVGVIASAKRPIILAGRGAGTPQGRAALLRLAERIGAPVATSLRGKDLFRAERFNLGICGTLANPVTLDILSQSDCIIAFGAGLNKWTTAEGSILAKKRVVHIDVERESINKFSLTTVGVVGDAVTVADTFVTWLDEAEISPSEFASEELAQQIASFSDADFADVSTEETVDIRTALLRVEKAFPEDRTLVLDGGRFVMNSFTMLHVPNPRAYVHTLNYGSIGLGMGNAVGASLGEPSRPVLLISGDGGFMLGGLADFNSAVRHKVDLVVIILNDGAYGAEHTQFRMKDMDPKISMFDWPDFGPVATALGGQGLTVHNLAELDEALATIPNRDRPILIDIKIDPDKVGMAGH